MNEKKRAHECASKKYEDVSGYEREEGGRGAQTKRMCLCERKEESRDENERKVSADAWTSKKRKRAHQSIFWYP